ncbi:hypothetical protein PG993_012718 [Apiospora rasikravindrae]|uniref:Uncharacterized protein n=1 Tax=Apiospora rasikravindrae TaxID=990691 RepID=A0ABR1S4I3_9PEZI
MPSVGEPLSRTPASYSSMVKSNRGGREQEKLVHTDGPSASTLPSHGRGSNTNNPSSSQRSQQSSHQQRRGRARGGYAAYYRTPSSQQQQHHQIQHTRKEHNAEEEDVYVLTLLTDPVHERAMSDLRRRWFPAQRLKVDAHMTLFHALPGRFLNTIKQDLADTAAKTDKLTVEAGSDGVFRMGRKGVAVKVQGCEGVVGKMRRGLIDRWEELCGDEEAAVEETPDGPVGGGKTHGVLSAQDSRRDWKAHYTIMNKEENSARVEDCFNELRGTLEQTRGTVLGLRLWRYDRGWWRQEEDFLFEGGSS